MLVDNLCDHGCHSMEIVDQLRIPADLPKGDYVLGWRWGARYHHQAGFFLELFIYDTLLVITHRLRREHTGLVEL